MEEFIAIHKLSEQMGLTSRTLRHWESEGLYQSTRSTDSTWRAYDVNSVLCIRITALLRQFDVPIKEIKTVVEAKTFEAMLDVVANKISTLKEYQEENMLKENQLQQLLLICQEHSSQTITDERLAQMSSQLSIIRNSDREMEENSMLNKNESNSSIRIITLPAMRVVYNIAVGVSPEDEAMTPVVEWIKSVNLVGTARLFGGNVKPLPSGNGKPYGYGMCASIPSGVAIPGHLKEMELPGGLYALLESSDDITGSWKNLVKLLSKNNKYEPDRSRLCFEEHIRNDNPDGSGNEYFLNLLEPVKLKVQ